MSSLTSLTTLKDIKQLLTGELRFVGLSNIKLIHIQSYAASVILRVTYGKSTPTATDAPEIIVIQKMLKRFQMLMRPGALLVERYPILKYVPGYASYLEDWRREESQLFHVQLNRVSKELVSSCNVFPDSRTST